MHSLQNYYCLSSLLKTSFEKKDLAFTPMSLNFNATLQIVREGIYKFVCMKWIKETFKPLVTRAHKDVYVSARLFSNACFIDL